MQGPRALAAGRKTTPPLLVLVLVLVLVLLLVPLLLLLQPCVDIGGGKWVGDCVCLS